MERRFINELEGFENFKGYSITEDGMVFSHFKRHDKIWIVTKEPQKQMAVATNKKGYKTIRLSAGSKKKSVRIHRLVALAFIPNPNNKPQVNHIDGDKANNHISNLEWVTGSENHKHKVEHGLNIAKSGAEHYMRIRNFQEGDHHCCKCVLQIDNNGNIVAKYKSLCLAAKSIGIGYSNISKAVHGHIKSAGGYMWEFGNEGSTTIPSSGSRHKRVEMGNSCNKQDEDIV